MMQVPGVNGNGCSGHDPGNNGFWTDGQWQEDDRVGKVREVRGDEKVGMSN